MKITIALEWFLNPDHLPFIVGMKKGWFQDAGLELELIEPREHYDGFEGLRTGEITIAVNEPLHLLEHYRDDLVSLGCYFETEGGVIIKKAAFEHLRMGGMIRVTTPAANDVTDRIGFEIIARHCRNKGFEVSRDQVEFVQTDFYHIKNLQDGYGAAWLCFENYEVIEAEFAGLDFIMMDSKNSGYANFSALDFITTKKTYADNIGDLNRFVQIVERTNRYLAGNVNEAKEIFYDYTKTEKSDFEDRVIEATLAKLLPTIDRTPAKWMNLYRFLKEIGVTTMSESEYISLF